MNLDTPQKLFHKFIERLANQRRADGHLEYEPGFFRNISFEENEGLFIQVLKSLDVDSPEGGYFNLDSMVAEAGASNNLSFSSNQANYWSSVCRILEETLVKRNVLKRPNNTGNVNFSWLDLASKLEPFQHLRVRAFHKKFTLEDYRDNQGVQRSVLAGSFRPTGWLYDQDLDVLRRKMGLEADLRYTISSESSLSATISLALKYNHQKPASYKIPIILSDAPTAESQGSHWMSVIVTVNADTNPPSITAELLDSLPMADSTRNELEELLRNSLNAALSDVSKDGSLEGRYAGYQVGDVQVGSDDSQSNGYSCLDYALYHVLDRCYPDSQNPEIRAVLDVSRGNPTPKASELRRVILEALLRDLKVSEEILAGDQVALEIRDQFEKIEGVEPAQFRLKPAYVEQIISGMGPLSFQKPVGRGESKSPPVMTLWSAELAAKQKFDGQLLRYQEDYRERFVANLKCRSCSASIEVLTLFVMGELHQYIQAIAAKTDCHELELKFLNHLSADRWSVLLRELSQLKNVTRFRHPGCHLDVKYSNHLRAIEIMNQSPRRKELESQVPQSILDLITSARSEAVAAAPASASATLVDFPADWAEAEIKLTDYLGVDPAEWPLQVKALIEVINQQRNPSCGILKITAVSDAHVPSLQTLVSGLTTVTHFEITAKNPEDSLKIQDTLQPACEAIALRNQALAFIGIRSENTEAAWLDFLMVRLNQVLGGDRSVEKGLGLNLLIEGNMDRLAAISSFDRIDFNQRLLASPAEFLERLLSACNALNNGSGFQIGTLSFNTSEIDSNLSEQQHEHYNLQSLTAIKAHAKAGGYFPCSAIEFLMPQGSEVSGAFLEALKEVLLVLHANHSSLKLVIAPQQGGQHFSKSQMDGLKAFYEQHKINIELDIATKTENKVRLASFKEGAESVYTEILNNLANNRRAAQIGKYQPSAEVVVAKAVNQPAKPREDIPDGLVRACKLGDVAINIEISEETSSAVETQAATSVNDDVVPMVPIPTTAIAPLNPDIDLKSLITPVDIRKMIAIPGFFENYNQRAHFPINKPSFQQQKLKIDESLNEALELNAQNGMPKILEELEPTFRYKPEGIDAATWEKIPNQSQYFLQELLGPLDIALTPAAFAAIVKYQTVFLGTINLDNLPDGFNVGEYHDENHKARLALDYDPLKVSENKTPLTPTLTKRQPYQFLGDMSQLLNDEQMASLIDNLGGVTAEAKAHYVPRFYLWDNKESLEGKAKPAKTYQELRRILMAMNEAVAKKIEAQYPWAFETREAVFADHSYPLIALFSILHYAGMEGLDAFLGALDTLRTKSGAAFNAIVKNFIAIERIHSLAHLSTPESIAVTHKITSLSDSERELWNHLLNKHFQFNEDGYSDTGHHTGLVELFNGFEYFIQKLKDAGLSLSESFIAQIGKVNFPNMMTFMDRVLRLVSTIDPRYRESQLDYLSGLDWTNQGAVYAALHDHYRFVHPSMNLKPSWSRDDKTGEYRQSYKVFFNAVREVKYLSSKVSLEGFYGVGYSDLIGLVENSSNILGAGRYWGYLPAFFLRYLGCTRDAINHEEFHRYVQLGKALSFGEERIIPNLNEENPQFAQHERFKIELHAIAAIATTGRGAREFNTEKFFEFLGEIFEKNPEADSYDEKFRVAAQYHEKFGVVEQYYISFHAAHLFIARLFQDPNLEKPTLDEMTGLLRLLYHTPQQEQAVIFDIITENSGRDLWKAFANWNRNPDRVPFTDIISVLKRMPKQVDAKTSCADVLMFMGCVRVPLVQLSSGNEGLSLELQTIVDQLLKHPLREHIIDYVKQIKIGEMSPQLLSPENLQGILTDLRDIAELPRLKTILKERLPIAKKAVDDNIESAAVVASVAPTSLFRAKLVNYIKTHQDEYLQFLSKPPLGLAAVTSIEDLTEENVLEKLVGKIKEIYDRTYMRFSLRSLSQALSGQVNFLVRKALSGLLALVRIAFSQPDLTEEGLREQAVEYIEKIIFNLSPESNPKNQSNEVQAIVRAYCGDTPTVTLGSLDEYFPLVTVYIEKAEPLVKALSKLTVEWQAAIAAAGLTQVRGLDFPLFFSLLEVLPAFQVNQYLIRVVLNNPALKDAQTIAVFTQAMRLVAKAMKEIGYQPLVYRGIFDSPALRDPAQMLQFAKNVAQTLGNTVISLAVRKQIIEQVAGRENLDLESMMSLIQMTCEKQSSLQDRIIPVIVALAAREDVGSAELKAAFAWMSELPNGDERISLLLNLCKDNPDYVALLIEICPRGWSLKDYLSVLLLTQEAVEDPINHSTTLRRLQAGQLGEQVITPLGQLSEQQSQQLARLYQQKPYPQFKKLQEILAKRQDTTAFTLAIESFDRDPSGLFDVGPDKKFLKQAEITRLYGDELPLTFPRIMADLRVIDLNGHKRPMFREEQEKLLEALVYINDRSLKHAAGLSSHALQAEFKALSELIRNKATDPKVHYKARLDLIALMREAYRRTSGGKLPRLVQLLPLLLSADGNALTQINTGGGKTLINAMQAVIKHAQGGPVVVLTSDNSLAFDGAEGNETFFRYLGIDSGFIHSGSPLASYQKEGIHYAEASELALFLQRHESVLGKDIDEVLHFVLDEADFLAFDNPSTSRFARNLSGAAEVTEAVRDAYAVIFDFVSKDNLFLKVRCTPAEDIDHLKEYVQNPENRIPSEVVNAILNFGGEKLGELIDDAYAVKQMLAKPGKPFELRTLTLKNPDTELDEAFLDARVLKSDGRAASDNSRFSRYVHPILHAVIARDLKAKDSKNQFYAQYIKPLVDQNQYVKAPKVSATRHTLSQMNAIAMLLRSLRQGIGSDVVGSTGTLAADKLSALVVAAGMHAYIIPPHEESKMVIMPTMIANTAAEPVKSSRFPNPFKRKASQPKPLDQAQLHAEAKAAHLAKIVEIAVQEAQAGNPVLLFAETDEYAADIASEVEKALKKLSGLGVTLQDYVKEQGDTPEKRKAYEKTIVKQAGQPRMITVTTLLGRGTDVEVVAPDTQLVVIDTSLHAEADKRGYDQRRGRTARNGEQGRAYLVLSENEFSARGMSVPKTPEDIEMAIETIRANIAIGKGQDWFIKNKSAAVLTQIQDAYVQFMRRLNHVFEINYQNMGSDARLGDDWKEVQRTSWQIWAEYYKHLETLWASQESLIYHELHNFDPTNPSGITREQFLQNTLENRLDAFIAEAKGSLWNAMCQDVITSTNAVYERTYADYVRDKRDLQEQAVSPGLELIKKIKRCDQELERLDVSLDALKQYQARQKKEKYEGEWKKQKREISLANSKRDEEMSSIKARKTGVSKDLRHASEELQKAEIELNNLIPPGLGHWLWATVVGEAPNLRQARERVQGLRADVERLQTLLTAMTARHETLKQENIDAHKLRDKAIQAVLESHQREQLEMQVKKAEIVAQKEEFLQQLSQAHQDLALPTEYFVSPALTLEQLNLKDRSAAVTARSANVERLHQPLVSNFSMTTEIPTVAQAKVAIEGDAVDRETKQLALLDVLKNTLGFALKLKRGEEELLPSQKIDLINRTLELALLELLKAIRNTQNPATQAAIKRQYWALLEGVKLYGSEREKQTIYDVHKAFIVEYLPEEERRIERALELGHYVAGDLFGTPATRPTLSPQELRQHYSDARRFYVNKLYELGDQGFLPAGITFAEVYQSPNLWSKLLKSARDEVNAYNNAWWKSSDRKIALADLERLIAKFELLETNQPGQRADEKIKELIAKLDELSHQATRDDYQDAQTKKWFSFRNSKEDGSRFQKMLSRIREEALRSLSTDEQVYRTQARSIVDLKDSLLRYQGLARFNKTRLEPIFKLLRDFKIGDSDVGSYQSLILLKEQLNVVLSGITLKSLGKNERGFYQKVYDLRDKIASLEAAVSVSQLRKTLTHNPETVIQQAVQAVAGSQPLSANEDFCRYIADRYHNATLRNIEPGQIPRVYQVLYAFEAALLKTNPDVARMTDIAVTLGPDEELVIAAFLRLKNKEVLEIGITTYDFAQQAAITRLPIMVKRDSLRLKKPVHTTAAMLAALPQAKVGVALDKDLAALLTAIVMEYNLRGYEPVSVEANLGEQVKELVALGRQDDPGIFEKILKSLAQKNEKFKSLIDDDDNLIQELRDEFYDAQDQLPSIDQSLAPKSLALLDAIVDAYAKHAIKPARDLTASADKVNNLVLEHEADLVTVYLDLQSQFPDMQETLEQSPGIADEVKQKLRVVLDAVRTSAEVDKKEKPQEHGALNRPIF